MNRKLILLVIAVITSIGLVACGSNTEAEQTIAPESVAPDTILTEAENPSVSVLENSIIYSGDITPEGVERVKSLFTDEITKLVITSKEGDMHAGMDLGEFVYDNGLDVEVKDYAFSTAANYVITSAKTLHLNENSVIGFNGGLSDVSREDEKLERDFFKKIGVQQQITSLGNKASFADKAKDKDGFTYTIEALDKLGVKNIMYHGETWENPSNDMFDLFTINRDEFYSTEYMDYESAPDAPPIEYSVTVEGNSIIYDGELSSNGLEEIKDLYTAEIDRLVINSPGGEINVGMDFGEFIFDNKLDVEVKELAFSSAANYVITAADTLYLHKDAVIGWHGGATQEIDSPEVQVGGEFYEYNQDSIKRETEFYEKIGVNQQITVYGQDEKFLEEAMEIEAFGWTYDIETLNKLGVDSVEFVGEPWIPNTTLNFMEHSFNLLLIDEFA